MSSDETDCGCTSSSFDYASATELEPTLVDGKDGEGLLKVRTFRLIRNNVSVELCSIGASILRLLLPGTDNEDGDADVGSYDNVVLGFDNVGEMYETGNPMYFGVTPGRVANRIGRGIFQTTPGGAEYQLETNNGPNHLHGGSRGFSTRIWDAEIVSSGDDSSDGDSVKFSYLSTDGEEGYPGTVQVSVTYSLMSTPNSKVTKLNVLLKAELLDDKPSPINLTQHSYFNLAGDRCPEGILGHFLRLYCDAYTPTDDNSIPTRQVKLLEDDPVMDWRCLMPLRGAIMAYGMHRAELSVEQAEADLSQRDAKTSGNTPYGFDHNYVVRNSIAADGLKLVALLMTGPRRLTIQSTQPGVQLYTANYLDGTLPRTSASQKDGATAGYHRWQGLCLETQHFPDSILVDGQTHPEFAAGQCPILTPKSPLYEHSAEYTFETTKNTDSTASATSMTGFHGTDSDGHHYYSVEDMWEEQGVTAESSTSWYERASAYYKENCPSTVDGVLGGFATISEPDLQGSWQFVRDLEQVRPTIRSWTTASALTRSMEGQEHPTTSNRTPNRACECGAGLGRVTKGLLYQLEGIDQCDLVDSSAELLAAAPDYLGNTIATRCRYFCSGLQDWMPTPSSYCIVWVQWVLSYLTDNDIVAFLRRCGQSLTADGVIILKENTCDESDFEVDIDDASVTRSLRYWKVLIRRAGLRVIHETQGVTLLRDLYPVPILALEVGP